MTEARIEGQNAEAARALVEAGCIKFGEFTLASGLKSPFYVDLRRLRSFPPEKLSVVNAYEQLLAPLHYDILADVPTAATPLVSSLSDRLLIPQITPRADVKGHGSGAKIDGFYEGGEVAVVVDDLITTSRSKLGAIEILEEEGIKVMDVVVLIDRQQGGREELERLGYNLHAAFTMPNLMGFYSEAGLVTPEQFQTVMDYLAK